MHTSERGESQTTLEVGGKARICLGSDQRNGYIQLYITIGPEVTRPQYEALQGWKRRWYASFHYDPSTRQFDVATAGFNGSRPDLVFLGLSTENPESAQELMRSFVGTPIIAVIDPVNSPPPDMIFLRFSSSSHIDRSIAGAFQVCFVFAASMGVGCRPSSIPKERLRRPGRSPAR
jgi:hypothetical protein